MSHKSYTPPKISERQTILVEQRNLKMARSAHAYVRGNTLKFYEWLMTAKGRSIPKGPSVWICGDCHLGNLGPVANVKGRIDIQIRDLDQTVIGNPAHDLIRLGLSLACAARGSDLPGVATVKMLEGMMEGYEKAFEENEDGVLPEIERPEAVKSIMKKAVRRSWKHLARERIDDTLPTIPLGKRFWPISKEEKEEIITLFKTKEVRKLVTLLRSRDDDARVEVLDAAYWMKGCSSLGRMRFAVLVSIGDGNHKEDGLCLMDIKEAIAPAAPRHSRARMPKDHAERVVEGARNLAPYLGDRMLATRFLNHSVFLRELMPQDLKLEIDQLTSEEAMKVATYLAMVVGKAHARQMDEATRKAWQAELNKNRFKTLDAPSWLWSSIIELVVSHEAAYLEHCRRYAMGTQVT